MINAQSSKEDVLIEVARDGLSLRWAIDELRDDVEVVRCAIFEYAYSLQYASERLRSNRELVIMAVNLCGEILEFASPELRDDKEVVRCAILTNYLESSMENEHALQFASDRLRNNRSLVMIAISFDSYALEHASLELRDNMDIGLAMLDGFMIKSLRYLSSRLRRNPKLIAIALLLMQWPLKEFEIPLFHYSRESNIVWMRLV